MSDAGRGARAGRGGTGGNTFWNASSLICGIPVLLSLVQQAYDRRLARRTGVKVEPREDVPFREEAVRSSTHNATWH